MSLLIDFIDETEQLASEQLQQLKDLLEHGAAMEEIPDGTELSVTFVTNARIHQINKEYRHKDAPTDVISFAMEEMGEGEMEITGADLPRVLGDIIISVERAKSQAEDYGHSFMREVGFLSVHGFLHLLGYDHMNEEDEKAMFTRQDEILNQYGLIR